MKVSVYEDKIYLSAECEAEKLQIREIQQQLERYKLAWKDFGYNDNVNIYIKTRGQYLDEHKMNRSDK